MMESAWKVVRRKQRLANNQETTYFVTKMPKEEKKGELWRVFEKYGKLSDVYIGQNLGKNKQYYAFIRYRGVGNAKELERRLDGVKVGGKTLVVNIALHKRKVPMRDQNQNEQYRRLNVEQTAMAKNNGMRIGTTLRDHRSYADMLRPVNTAQTPPWSTASDTRHPSSRTSHK
ncbi:unnamed protein product [Lactuca saligna]|uniref:RRM domain-containing protein n=1 Tax=Lactuca saligna TaxID=75948 RepID=A0AA35VGK8_LACSI|nr:unnamed protein product [Lactuca saligna]